MRIYQPIQSKINKSYYWCEVEDDGALIFGFDDGEKDKIVLSKNSYNYIAKYIDEVNKKLEYYKSIYYDYYEKIKKEYMYTDDKIFKWEVFET